MMSGPPESRPLSLGNRCVRNAAVSFREIAARASCCLVRDEPATGTQPRPNWFGSCDVIRLILFGIGPILGRNWEKSPVVAKDPSFFPGLECLKYELGRFCGLGRRPASPSLQARHFGRNTPGASGNGTAPPGVSCIRNRIPRRLLSFANHSATSVRNTGQGVLRHGRVHAPHQSSGFATTSSIALG